MVSLRDRSAALIGLTAAVVCCSAAPAPQSRGSQDPPSAHHAGAGASAAPVDSPAPVPEAPRCEHRPAPAARREGAGPRLVLQDGHTSAPIRLLLSRDGRVAATGGLDGMLRVWDTQSGLVLRKVSSPAGVAALAAAGNVLAYQTGGVGAQPGVSVLDLDRDGEPRPLGEYGAVAVSPDGRRVAVGFEGVRLYDTASARKTGELVPPSAPAATKPPAAGAVAGWKAERIYAMSFDAAGKRLAAATGAEILVVDVGSSSVMRRLPHPDPRGAAATPTAVTFADGERLVLVTPVGVHVVPLGGGAPRPLPGAYLDAAVSGDRVLTAAVTGELGVWDLGTGARRAVPATSGLSAFRVGASADGSTVALARLGAPDVRLVDGKSFRPLRTLEGKTRAVVAVATSPGDSELFAAGADGAVARWNLATGELTSQLPAAPAVTPWIGLDAPGKLLARAAGADLSIADAATGRVTRRWRSRGLVLTASFAGGGSELVTLSRDGSLEAWDLAAAPARPSTPDERARPPGRLVASLPGPIVAAAFAEDGKHLAFLAGEVVKTTPDPSSTAGWRWAYAEAKLGVVALSDGSTRWTIGVTTGFAARWLAFGPDGSVLLSAVQDPRRAPDRATQFGSVRDARVLSVFDGATGKAVRSAAVPTAGPIGVLRDVVAVGGLAATLVRWPDLALVARVPVPDNEVTVIAVQPKQRRFVLGGDSGASSVVTGGGEVVAMLTALAGGDYVALTPDGLYRASLDGARSVGWAFGSPVEGFSFEQFAARFQRSEEVARRLSGERAEAAPPVPRPPRVRIAPAALDRATADGRRVRVHVEAPTWVERLRVFVDGRRVAERAVCAASADVDLDVPLPAGRSRVTAIAYDADGLASNAASVDAVRGSDGGRRPDLWMVSVGVSRYRALPAELQLAFADDDARAIAAAGKALAGEGKPFAKVHETLLVDDEATVESIERAVGELGRMAPADLAIVFLAGHGVRGPSGKTLYLTATASATAARDGAGTVSWERIAGGLGRARGRVVVLLDACHGGHLATDVATPNDALAHALAADDRAGVVVFAAARGAELSYEVETGAAGTRGGSRGLTLAWDGKPATMGRAPAAGHGLFTSALLEALAGEAVDRDGSGAIELGELVDYVTERVRASSNGKQTPWVARREMFGDFAVARPR